MSTEVQTSKAPGAAALCPVLHEFAKLVRRSADSDHEDAPHLYHEKTLVGVLGAAAWASGGTALWEFSADKGRGQTRRSGRVDLFIKTATRRTYVFEAKRDERRMAEDFDDHARWWAGRMLSRARGDARSTPGAIAEHRAGLAFLVPVFPAERAGRNTIERFLSCAAESDWDLWCWAPCRQPFLDEGAEEVLPGVLLLGKFC